MTTESTAIADAVANEVNIRLAKITWAIWSGVFAFIAAAVTMSIQWGSLKTQVENNKAHQHNTDLHMSTDAKMKFFVTRPEFEDLKVAIHRIDDKLDTLRKVQ